MEQTFKFSKYGVAITDTHISYYLPNTEHHSMTVAINANFNNVCEIEGTKLIHLCVESMQENFNFFKFSCNNPIDPRMIEWVFDCVAARFNINIYQVPVKACRIKAGNKPAYVFKLDNGRWCEVCEFVKEYETSELAFIEA